VIVGWILAGGFAKKTEDFGESASGMNRDRGCHGVGGAPPRTQRGWITQFERMRDSLGAIIDEWIIGLFWPPEAGRAREWQAVMP
jgi:hypothetical protein